jgi:uncharacterized repeat protein (TIGR03803 family)
MSIRQIIIAIGSILFFLSTYNSSAQGILATCTEGGNQFGTILHIDEVSESIQYKKLLEGTPGATPTNCEVLVLGDLVYGTTQDGGSYGSGVLYSYNTVTKKYLVLHNFDSASGCKPFVGVAQLLDGKFYGTTYKGGSYDRGVLYEFDIVKNAYTKKLDLNPQDGYAPASKLIVAKNNKVYLCCGSGGGNLTSAGGSIMSYDVQANKLKVVHKFSKQGMMWPTGKNPNTNLVEHNGILYGATFYGGDSNRGVVYAINSLNDSVYTVAHLSAANCEQASGSLALVGSKLFGTASKGTAAEFGAVYMVDLSKLNITRVAILDGTNGRLPEAGIVSDGKTIYGAARFGGQFDYGTLFTVDPTTYKLNAIFSFGEVGVQAKGPLTLVGGDKIYGTCNAGAVASSGSLYCYNLKSRNATSLLAFSDAPLGAKPIGKMQKLDAQNFIGVMQAGGDYNAGVVYRYNIITHEITKLASFRDKLGREPNGALLLASDGNYYGVCMRGGQYDEGTLYRFNLSTNSITQVHDFGPGKGHKPFGNVAEYKGKLLVCAFENPLHAEQGGAIVEYDIAAGSANIACALSNSTGDYPRAGLQAIGNGKFVGTASSGGANYTGAVYLYDASTQKIQHSFICEPMQGMYPFAAVTQLDKDVFVGTTSEGGLFKAGVVYTYNASTNKYAKLFDFTNTTGHKAAGDILVYAKNKMLLATTSGGESAYGNMLFCGNTGGFAVTKSLSLGSSSGYGLCSFTQTVK